MTPEEVTVAEAKQRRRELSVAILKLLAEFERDTCCRVTSVDTRRVDVTDVGDPAPHSALLSVNVLVELP